MATQFSITHGGNIGTLRVRIEDLKEVVNKDGKKVKQWVLSPNSETLLPHATHSIHAAANARRILIEEQPT